MLLRLHLIIYRIFGQVLNVKAFHISCKLFIVNLGSVPWWHASCHVPLIHLCGFGAWHSLLAWVFEAAKVVSFGQDLLNFGGLCVSSDVLDVKIINITRSL